MNTKSTAPGMTRLVLDVPTAVLERLDQAWKATYQKRPGLPLWDRASASAAEAHAFGAALGELDAYLPLELGPVIIAARMGVSRDEKESARWFVELLESAFNGYGEPMPAAALAEIELGERAAKALAGSAVAG